MKKRKINPLSLTGNIFIVCSVVIFVFIFTPYLLTYLPRDSKAIDTTSAVVIPKIGAVAPVLYNVDPFNSGVYKKALTQGVAHAKGSSLPGENGKVFLFAHSSGMPWELTRYNTIFLRLNELTADDEIDVYRNGTKYTYKVTEKKEVWPSEVSYLLEKSTENELILQTCSPIGTDLKRLLVFAKQS